MATIKGKWQFTNDSRRMASHPVHYCEQLVNFISAGYYDGTKMFTKLIFEYDEYDMPYIKFYCEEMGEYKFLTRSDSGAINLSVISLIDFGDTPQDVSDDFLGLMNLVAVPTNDDGTITLNGKYVVSPAGVGKIFTDSNLNGNYGGPPSWYTISYTNTIPGAGYNFLACFNAGGGAELYFGDATGSYDSYVEQSIGFQRAEGFQIIDFGQQNQTIDAIFYGEVLRYALIPIGNEFVDATGLATMVSKLKTKTTNQITTAARNAKATMTTIRAYTASANTTNNWSWTGMNLTNYDMLLLIVTPSTSSTQIFLTVSMDDLKSGKVSSTRVAASDNTNTTYFDITATSITSSYGYSGNVTSAQAKRGYIKGVYGLKIGG